MSSLPFAKRTVAFVPQKAGKKSLSRTLGWMDQYLEHAVDKVITYTVAHKGHIDFSVVIH